MLENIKLDADVVVEEEADTLGGGGGVLDSGLYQFEIKAAYIDYAQSKAMSVNLLLEKGSRSLKVTEYITSGQAKGCKAYYEKNGKKYPLPGHAKMSGLCQLLTGKTIDAMETEAKTLKLYDFDQRKEVPVEKACLIELHGLDVIVGVRKYIEDKKTKNESWEDGDDPTTKYLATGETRELNEADKFFNDEGLTLAEAKNPPEEGSKLWNETWIATYKGKTKDRSTGASSGSAKQGAPNTPKGSTKKIAFS